MATTSLLVAVGLAGLVFLVLGEMPRRAQPRGQPWMRDPEAHPQLGGAELRDAVLVDADLTEADLTGARAAGADLTGAVLTGAVLTGVDLGDVVLDGVCWDESSPPLWPDGFDPPAGGSEACPD